MFDIDKWTEILTSLRKNILRTILTGLTVAWGIFMLIILLGAGKGLENFVAFQFRDDAVNSIWIRSGQTSIPHDGYQAGRYIQMTNADYEYFDEHVEGVDNITGRHALWSAVVNYGANGGTFSMRGVHSDHQYLENTMVTSGRYINALDVESRRKVVVIGQLVAQELFREDDPIGKYVRVFGIPFKVVGVFTDEGGPGEEKTIYVPISTSQMVFNGANRISNLMFTTGDLSPEEIAALAEKTRLILADRHHFAPEDVRAMRVRSPTEDFEQINSVMTGIRVFIWFIGIMTIIAGIMGISNIMIVVVKERTREIGVRKALGATPGSVVSLILMESIFLTSVAGYVGLVAGVGVLEGAAGALEGLPFSNPTVEIRIAVYATIVLVISGALAGLVPSLRAARIRPIEALRDE
jgi:putative ABC transport system permease protein